MRVIVGFLIVIGLIFVGILLLVRLLFGGSDPAPQPKDDLVDSATTTQTMQLTIQGPVTADQEHKQIKVEVSASQTRLELITGYEGRADKTEVYSNNATSYADFLRGLDLLGYTQGSDDRALKDERGYCPTGQRFVFEIKDGSETKQRYWSSTCKDTGSYKGLTTQTVNLFKAQIPNFSAVTNGYN